ncbi:MAG: hypothetical protein MZV70_65335 [Desulfobacterales bacterium]|nr:hypothetical protein [Desulfobacterales bacterium]
MRTVIAPGLTEMEFAGMFEAYARTIGHGGKLRVRHYNTEGYSWHVLSGTSGGTGGGAGFTGERRRHLSRLPGRAPGNRRLRPVSRSWWTWAPVMNGYHMDETRMFAIGSMPEKAVPREPRRHRDP